MDSLEAEDARLAAFWSLEVMTWLEGRPSPVMAPREVIREWQGKRDTMQRRDWLAVCQERYRREPRGTVVYTEAGTKLYVNPLDW